MTMQMTDAFERSSRRDYEREISKGAYMFNIVGGHTLDHLDFCFGSLEEVSAKVRTRVKQLRMVDTGELVDAEAADTVLASGVLNSGALLSYHLSTVPFHAEGWRLAVYGSKGTIIATTQGLPQITPVALAGAQGNEPLSELQVPDRLRFGLGDLPFGPPQNVGRAYIRMAEAIREGKKFSPSFENALKIHKLLEVIQQSSDEGRIIRLG